jgi:hypothetical protein
MRLIMMFLVILISAAGIHAQEPGDDCSNPIPISISISNYDPFFTTDLTCGRGNSASNTCMGMYDGGEDIFYEITLDFDAYLDFILDPHGTAWTAMALSINCPPSGSEYEDCIAFSSNISGAPHEFQVWLAPGVYYLMIDTWPTPDCIPSFDLSIIDVLYDDFMTCVMPYYVELSQATSFLDEHQSTCGWWDDYSETCLGNYDGGEDIIYEIYVTRLGEAIFRIDPHATTYTGIALGTSCPPSDIEPDKCLAMSQKQAGEPHGFTVDLEEGVYYLIVDTWPAPDCIEDFNLSISFTPPKICGDVNDDMQVNVSDAVYIINYVFVGGDPPVIQRSGDVNCDENTNISDAVWIINYVFVGGNDPCDTDGNSEPDC